MSSPGSRAAGFTLVEVAVVAALLVPLVLVVGTASKGVVGAIEANDRAAETSSVAVLALGELENVLRFGRLGTLSVQATRPDVQAGLAANVGDWCPMQPLSPRPGIQLSSLTGERDDQALVLPAQVCRLMFVRDAAELANNADDDGYGLVDEGELQCTRGGLTTKLLDGVELCTFELDTGRVRANLRYGKRGHGQDVERTTLHHTVYLNNH